MTDTLTSPARRPPTKLSEVEIVKLDSEHLRGSIARGLADADTATFVEDDASLLKFHGIYQQYDRDTATERKQRGQDKEYQFMARLRVPAGRLSADQYLALDALTDRLGNGTLRITTRQTFQYHGVLKGNLKALIASFDGLFLTTLAACGDVVRNVTATPAPVRDRVHATLDRIAREISTHFLPRSGAWHEIWVDGQRVAGEAEEPEPIYGAAYLPRKFKIGLATPDDNSIDVLTNDLGIIALFDGQRLQGFNVAVGGGSGMTHNKPKTYPRLASPLLFVEPDGLMTAVEAIVKVQRDHGDRADRKHARLKYLIDDKGLAWMKATVEAYAGRAFDWPRETPRLRIRDHLGWHPQGGGRWYLGIPVSSGRIVDSGTGRLRTALREVIAAYRPAVVLTPQQDIILADIRPGQRRAITAALRAQGVALAEDQSPFRRWTLACPALPTCGLALTEAERIRDPLVERVEEKLRAHGLERERISLRITGCPNGCARPYSGDIGLVGRMPGYYALYVGGDFEGTRLSFRLLDKVAYDEVPGVLDTLFGAFAAQRQTIEGFGDYCTRVGQARLASLLEAAMPPVAI